MTLDARIAQLSDADARRLLVTFTRPLDQDPARTTTPDAALVQALTATFGAPATTVPPDEGDLARTALRLLAADPATEPRLTALLDGPRAERFIEPSSIAITTAVLLALQLHVRIERTKDGQWKLLIEKPSMSGTVLKPLVDKLVAFFSRGG
jgi:hypothetical protein